MRSTPAGCARCNAPVKRKGHPYCSKACSNRGRALPESTRFWNLVDKTGDCWLWTAAISRNGYGSFLRDGRRQAGAHRVAWELSFGNVPPGLNVLHHCDVRNCVRPSHLFVGTHKINMTDRNHKERLAFGERSGTHKLTEDNVRAIRAAYAAGGISQQALADHYGTSQFAISALIRRKSWARVV